VQQSRAALARPFARQGSSPSPAPSSRPSSRPRPPLFLIFIKKSPRQAVASQTSSVRCGKLYVCNSCTERSDCARDCAQEALLRSDELDDTPVYRTAPRPRAALHAGVERLTWGFTASPDAGFLVMQTVLLIAALSFPESRSIF